MTKQARRWVKEFLGEHTRWLKPSTTRSRWLVIPPRRLDRTSDRFHMDPHDWHEVNLKINGATHRLQVSSNWTLNDALRNRLDLTGTKRACDYGGCGSCTVLMDGVDVYSCSILAIEAQGKEILTIEGLASGEKLHPLQQSFARSYAAQCGWCTPGMIMSAKALLDRNPNPTEKEVRVALSGVLCRCTGYSSIIQAVLEAARLMRGEP